MNDVFIIPNKIKEESLMSEDIKRLFDERLGRYQSAIALEPLDRIPIAAGTNNFAETYAGTTNQEVIYDPQKWLEGEISFCRAFPEVDVLRDNRFWGPLYDAIGLKLYKFPGRDLAPHIPTQFVEKENMKADEYDFLINNPAEFMLERFLPRVFSEMDKGHSRSHIAFLKGGLAQNMVSEIMRNRSIQLQNQCGMPQPMTGAFLAPFDVLGDTMRGLEGILKDTFRQPDKVIKACDMIAPIMARFALSTGDPLRRYPVFVPTHKATFLSPKQFDKFYWPSFKKAMLSIIDAGYKIRAYLEGDWSMHWHHFLELPKGSVLCDIDEPADNIFKAKQEIGHHQCLAGGIPSSVFILGTPQEMDERVKLLCEKAGSGGGYIISGGCYIPANTKPENYKAMIDAVMKYGGYDKNVTPKVLPPLQVKNEALKPFEKGMLTPWAVKKAELGNIPGEEDLIRKPWETIETMAFNWLWNWVF
jgi:uroporphyrinogen-III decarboxylase